MSKYDYVNQSLKNLCEECPNLNTSHCEKSQCLVGFTKNLFDLTEKNGTRILKNGESLIPQFDVRNYREELIADTIAEVCNLCAECRENHNEECVISLARRSLEIAVLPENALFHGSVLMYLMDVSKQNPQLAEMIKAKYMEKKGIAARR